MLVPEEVRKCVSFVGYNDGSAVRFAGTAFIVASEIKELPGKAWINVVTARHVIEKARQHAVDDLALLRMNTRAGEAQWIQTHLAGWYFHPTDEWADVAILDWAPPSETLEYMSIPEKMFVTDEVLARKDVGVGDEVFITGLFGYHYGTRRNIPIIRVGNIAALPEEKIRASRSWGPQDAYLIEARSLGGISGSPVFVHSGPLKRATGGLALDYKLYFLGLIHGHWDIPAQEGDLLANHFGAMESVNMGIAIVVPAPKIVETIMSPEKQPRRNETIKRMLTEAGAADALSAGTPTPTHAPGAPRGPLPGPPIQ